MNVMKKKKKSPVFYIHFELYLYHRNCVTDSMRLYPRYYGDLSSEYRHHVAKKAGKTQKNVSKTDKEKKRERKESHAIDIYKVLKQERIQTLAFRAKPWSIINSFVNDILERIAAEASHLAYTTTNDLPKPVSEFSCQWNYIVLLKWQEVDLPTIVWNIARIHAL